MRDVPVFGALSVESLLEKFEFPILPRTLNCGPSRPTARSSAVLVFQIRTLDRARFIKRIGALSPGGMAEVDRAILICFGMERFLV